MADDNYVYTKGRQKFGRPQALLFANNPGEPVIVSGKTFYIPLGNEVNSQGYTTGDDEFLILSDHNRAAIEIGVQRIEKRERTVNGRMRSYHVADKATFSTSWEMLPSRAYDKNPAFVQTTGLADPSAYSYTADGGAGGVELLDWYENNTGSFWVYLAYDRYDNFGNDYNNLLKYNEIVEVFFNKFSHSVQKRGNTTHDFWSVSIELEEV
jgi:hypothetical protein